MDRPTEAELTYPPRKGLPAEGKLWSLDSGRMVETGSLDVSSLPVTALAAEGPCNQPPQPALFGHY